MVLPFQLSYLQELRKFVEILQETEKKIVLVGHGLGKLVL
jgi:hypothetical protein